MDAIFVGRRAELDALAAVHRRVRAGSATTVVIEAPAGGGKSALLDRFAIRTEPAVVVRASGDEAETALAYGVYDQLDRCLIRSGGTAALPAALPRTASDRGDLQARGESLRDRLHAASRGLGVVVIIDDTHLSDRASLTALGFALRRLQGDPVLTILATRPESTLALPQGLLKLADADGTRMILEGLSVAEIRALAAHYGHGDLAERAARRLRDHTGGSPLHVRALLRDRQLGSGAWLSTPLPAPSSFARLVGARLAHLSQEARRLARAGAVLGLHCDLGTAAATADVGDPLAAVGELRDSQLARVETSAYQLRLVFEHSMIRTAVLQDCGDAVLAATHRAAAEHTRGAEALQHRVLATVGHDQELADLLEDQAQRDIARGGWRTAADGLLVAARLHPEPGTRDALLARGVYALLVAGDLAVAVGYRGQMEDLPESARQLQVLALMAWMTGDFALAEGFAERAWRFADQLDPRERDRLAGLLAQMSIMQGKGQAALAWSRMALDSGLLDVDAQASTLATLVGGMILEGRVQEALPLLPTTGDLNDAGYRELVGMRGLIQVLSDDPTSAAVNLRIRLRPNLVDHRRGQSPIELLTATGPDGIEPNKMVILLYLAEAEFRRGRWDVAAAIADQTLGLIEDTEQNWIVPWARAVAVLVPAARGQWEIAENHLKLAEETAARLGNEFNRGYAANAAVHLASCRSDPEQVVASAHWLLETGKPFQQEPGLHCWPVHYADALVTLGRYREAAEVLERWEAVARQRRHQSWIAALSRVRGDLAVRRRDLSAARRAFQAAHDAWPAAGEEVDALERAVLHLSHGRFLRRRGERRTAVTELREAERRFGLLGAEPFLTAVRHELAACGIEQGQDTEPPPAITSLTPQEAAVARLAVEGQSNKEIANTLVLSPKTVAYHLGHVYAKLGVRSRSQLLVQRLLDSQG